MIVVVKNRGIRKVHLAGVGFLTLAIGAIQAASQNGYFSTASNSPTAVSTDQSNANSLDLGAWGQSVPATQSTTGEVLPPPGTFVSIDNNSLGSNIQDDSGVIASQSPTYPGVASDFSPQPSISPQNANSQSYGAVSAGSPGDIQVYFSPKGGCTAAIVEQLNRAQRQILIQAYSFTSEPIAAASVAAYKRGVQVCAVLDKSQETEQYSAADLLDNSGIPTLIDSQHAIAHNKVILIDGVTLITGSFNFTTNAENSNAENMLIIRNRPDLYAAYEKNFQHHLEHSQRYTGRGTTGKPSTTRGAHRSTISR